MPRSSLNRESVGATRGSQQVLIVAEKPGNAGGAKEDRFRKAEHRTMIWTQSQAHIMTSDTFRLAMRAREDLKMRRNALMGLLHRPEGLPLKLRAPCPKQGAWSRWDKERRLCAQVARQVG
jgi:hypothetical protein